MPEATEKTIAILIVDDHALFRESLVRLLHAERGFEVVAHCGSNEEALRVLQQRQVDVVLLDFDLGESNGTQFLSSAKRQGFGGKVLVVTAVVNQGQAAELIHAGISGIFMKHHSAALLTQAIRDVVNGKVFFEQELLQAAVAAETKYTAHSPPEQFTQRERQVLFFVFEGLANKEIAERLGVSESSVKATLQQLFAKTGTHTRAQLVRIALEQHKHKL
ncbi:MAG: DNA-binding response regulator [Acidobacteria bacterium]|nr:MAG: DNA-binding response regulator [Acidobacteriota bacterium]